MQSLSTRREWVEIFDIEEVREIKTSLSTRREWVEIIHRSGLQISCWSLSTRREWVEIVEEYVSITGEEVSLHTERVG